MDIFLLPPPPPMHRPLGCLLVLLAVAGCFDGRPLARMEEPQGTFACPASPPDQSAEGSIGPMNYHLVPPGGGYSRNGGILRFDWGDSPSFLRAVDVRMEWTTPLGGQELLAMQVQVDDDPSARSYIEGKSPLLSRVDIPRGAPLGDSLMVVYSTSGNATPIGSVALVDQAVVVTVQETYRCD